MIEPYPDLETPLATSDSEIPDYNDLIEEQGGQGRFQWLSFSLISPSFNLNGLIAYQLSYLLLLPKFSCDEKIGNDWLPIPDGSEAYEEKCKPEYFCDHSDTIKWQYE